MAASPEGTSEWHICKSSKRAVTAWRWLISGPLCSYNSTKFSLVPGSPAGGATDATEPIVGDDGKLTLTCVHVLILSVPGTRPPITSFAMLSFPLALSDFPTGSTPVGSTRRTLHGTPAANRSSQHGRRPAAPASSQSTSTSHPREAARALKVTPGRP